jgi:succinate dehydrogenase/fumarate reductase cytochrome b subunit
MLYFKNPGYYTTKKKKFTGKEEILMIWGIVSLLLLFWVLGLVFHIAGGLIHILLVVAIIVFIFKLISGRMGNKA